MAVSQVEALYGPIIIGIVFNVLLYGTMTTQTYIYLSTFKKDRKWMRAFVWFIFFADSLNTGFNIAFLYERLILGFGNEPAVMVANWVFNTDPAMTALIAFSVQLFFAWRVKLLVSNTYVTTAIMLCSLVQMLAGIATAVACGIIPHFIEFYKFKAVVIIWLAFAAIADVLIAVSLVLHLRGHRTDFVATDNLIRKLIRMTVQTGSITAAFAVVDLITFLVSPSTGLHLAFNFPLAKLYTNTLLSTLNARATTHGFGPLTPSAEPQERRVNGIPSRTIAWKPKTINLDTTRQPHPSKSYAEEHDLEGGSESNGTQVYVDQVKHVEVV